MRYLRRTALPLSCALLLTACAKITAPSGSELLADGDQAQTDLEVVIDDVLEVLDPGGDAPRDSLEFSNGGLQECPKGFQFIAREDLGNRNGWRFPEDEQQWRMEIGEELHNLGWTDIEGGSFDGDGPATTMVYASNPDVVDEMVLMFHPGEVADGVTIHVTGTCHPGDFRELTELYRERGGKAM